MRKIRLILFLIVLTVIPVLAQVSGKMNYQAVIRNTSGELVTNQNLGVKISILNETSNGDVLYSETHSLSTDAYGQIAIVVGDGTEILGDFSSIEWSVDDKYLKIEVDINGGTSYSPIGTSQILSVPYALYANNSDSAKVAGIAYRAYTSDIANFADSSRIAGMAYATGVSEFSDSARVSGMAYTADFANLANNASTADISDFADSARVAGMAYTANIADVLGSNGVYTTSTDTLFVVKDHDGNVIFAVFPDGAQIIVNESAKGKVGGFAVSGRSPAKAVDVDILKVTTDSTRIYVNDTVNAKGKVGGFAVSGRSPSKNLSTDILFVTADSTHIFINENIDTKGKVGGFAVSGRSPSKGSNDYFNISGSSSAEIIEPSEARILWYPKKEAFLSGRVLVESPDSVGTNSMATGFESKSIGDYSQALGYQSRAFGNNSTAIGYKANTKGDNSYAFGDSTSAIADGSYAIGTGAKATGFRSFSLGSKGINSGGGSVNPPVASGDYSYAFGIGCVASGFGSFALGSEAKASGDYSFSLGNRTQSFGSSSMAIGDGSKAYDWYAIAIGEGATANGEGAFAMGQSSTAGGDHSYCLSTSGETSGYYSTAIGNSIKTKSSYEVIVGSYNDFSSYPGDGAWNVLDPIFVVGNGQYIFPTGEVRSNALVVLKSGNTGIGIDAPTHILHINGPGRSTVSAWETSSDVRVKKNIQTLTGSLAKINMLRPVTFEYIDDYRRDKKGYEGQFVSFIAQEVKEVCPEMVKETVESYGDTSLTDFNVLNTSNLVPMLVEAIQEQQTQIEDLKAENEALKQKLNEIIEILNNK